MQCPSRRHRQGHRAWRGGSLPRWRGWRTTAGLRMKVALVGISGWRVWKNSGKVRRTGTSRAVPAWTRSRDNCVLPLKRMGLFADQFRRGLRSGGPGASAARRSGSCWNRSAPGPHGQRGLGRRGADARRYCRGDPNSIWLSVEEREGFRAGERGDFLPDRPRRGRMELAAGPIQRIHFRARAGQRIWRWHFGEAECVLRN